MSPRSSCEVSRGSCKRPRDHAPHAVRPIQNFACDFAHAIKFSDRNHFLMRGNLKDAVARRVHNRFSRAHMFFTKLLDNFRSRCRLVADRFSTDSFLKRFHHISRESMFVHREGLIEPDSRHLPMASGCVFSRRVRRPFAVRTVWFRRGRQMRERLNVCQSQLHQIWNRQRARFRNVAQRVSPDVPVVGGIRQLANSHAVQHDPDHTSKTSHTPRSKTSTDTLLRDSSTAPRQPLFRPF